VSGGIVVDTGSTDDTVDRINRLFTSAQKPLEIHHAPFVDFSQARNAALHAARQSAMPWDYLLLADADMELVVTRPDWLNGHDGSAYDLKQFGGALGYYNRRLVHRGATGDYQGVTHEYLDIPTAGVLDGAFFKDHADGANRLQKFQRDIALLEEAMKTETRPGMLQRYEFYLAQSYFDAGEPAKALEHYRKRVTLGGFPEECWYAQRKIALCREKLHMPAEFVWEALAAYRMRPHRAEPLCDLARFFRERGESFTSLLFSEAGLITPFPSSDRLFINEYTYRAGIKEEFSICAFYDPARRSRGAKAADQLALSGSEQAKINLYWYLQPLRADVPSFKAERIGIDVPAGWRALNPSVIVFNGKIVTLVRTVNYRIVQDEAGTWINYESDDGVIRTRNFLVSDSGQQEIHPPANFPEPPAFPPVRGFEDSRLFEWNGGLWTLSTVRELEETGICRQVLAPLDIGRSSVRYGDDWSVISPEVAAPAEHQKNWMPWARENGELQFVYRLGTLLDSSGKAIRRTDCGFDASSISGGSQVVKAADGLYLAVVHEARPVPGRVSRYYQHRFAALNGDGVPTGISPPFYLHDRQYEFVAGLALLPDMKTLIISYGVNDCEAWHATMNLDEVIQFICKDKP
jgi:glycosyltransferase involved in cell wall biosynthesis/predicted GH43/DUF377 family glycosyl hydrolase